MGLFQGAKGSAGHGHIHQDGLGRHGAPTLEQLNGQARVMTGQQGQPQGRGRGLFLGFKGPKQEDRPLGRAGCELKTTQGLWLGGGIEPGHQGAEPVAAQALLQGPEAVCGMAGTHH